MRITLITLNYNGAENTIKLLESLQNQTDSDFSVIVADNGSLDIQQLRDYSVNKPIYIIENGANLGFAGGNNPALHYAFKNEANWAVLINNDTWVESDFVSRLKANLGAKKGIVGLPLDEGKRIVYAGQVEWFNPTLQHYESQISKHNMEECFFYPIGAGLAISRQAYEKLGGLDENYFLYFEDADYAKMAHKANIDIGFISEPIIHHSVSATTIKIGSPLLLRYHYRNAIYFNFKNAPLAYKVLTIFWSVFIFIKQLLKILTGRHIAESRAILAGVIDFYQERMGYISKKIKVGIECEQIEGEIWGVGRIISQTLENIASRPELEKDFEFHLYFKSEIPKLSFLDNPIFHKKVIDQPFRHKSFVLYYYLFLPINLWFERLNIMFFPNYMLPIIFFGNSLVMLTEDIYYEMRSKQQKLQHRLAYRVFSTWAKWQADKIMAISETSKKELMRLFDIEPNRIVVNHLAVDSPKIDSSSKTRNCKLKTVNYLLFVGQAFPRRHLKESLLAFEKIASEFTDLKFIIVGPDKYNPPKIKQIQKDINSKLGKERVIWHERVSQEEIENLYRHAIATVYISSREAFGLPPLEGLVYGSIPVVADNPLSHELFGEYAVFVDDIDSVDAIAEAFREAMTNSTLREKIKGHIPEIISRYTWQAHTDRFIKIIKSMNHE